jgi:hypothetical protein
VLRAGNGNRGLDACGRALVDALLTAEAMFRIVGFMNGPFACGICREIIR